MSIDGQARLKGGRGGGDGREEREREREKDYYFTVAIRLWMHGQSWIQVKPADRDWQLSRCGNSPTPCLDAHLRSRVPLERGPPPLPILRRPRDRDRAYPSSTLDRHIR